MSKRKQFENMRDSMREREGSPDDFAYNGDDLDDDVIAELQRMSKNASTEINTTFSSREIRTGSLVWTPVGLKSDGEITREDWEDAGQLLQRLDASLQWLIGDWIVLGEHLNYGDRDTFAESIGFETKTIYDYAYVARNVEISVRTEILSFTHHKLVAAMTKKEQKKWLQKAEAEGWSVANLRDAVSGKKQLTTSDNNEFASEINRQRMNRVWRAVERGQWNAIEAEDIDELLNWLQAIRDKKLSK